MGLEIFGKGTSCYSDLHLRNDVVEQHVYSDSVANDAGIQFRRRGGCGEFARPQSIVVSTVHDVPSYGCTRAEKITLLSALTHW